MTFGNKKLIFWVTLIGMALFLPTLSYYLGPQNLISRWISILAILNFRELIQLQQLSDVGVMYAYWALLGLITALLSLWNKYVYVVVVCIVAGAHIAAGSISVI
jgi:hypothetical protein